MERYLLFMGSKYYPSGGAKDLVERFETLKAGIEAADSEIMKDFEEYSDDFPTKKEFLKFQKDYCWAHIYDTATQSIVWEF